MVEQNAPAVDTVLGRLHTGNQSLHGGGYSHEWFAGLVAHLQRSDSRDLKSALRTVLAKHVLSYTRNFDDNSLDKISEISAMEERLSTHGYTHLKLDRVKIDRIFQSLLGTRMTNHSNGDWIFFSPDFSLAPMSSYSTHHASHAANVLRFPEIVSLAQSELFLGLARRYLGALPRLVHWEFNLNQSGKLGPIPSDDWHMDKDCISFLKVFIYLSDVTPDAGPHAYVAGSNNANVVRAALTQSYPDDSERVEMLYENERWDQNTVREIFGRDRVLHCGPAGLAIVEDTRGLHHATPPVNGHRLMLTLEYGLDPFVLNSAPEPILYSQLPSSIRPKTGASEARFKYLFSNFLEVSGKA